MVGQEKIDRINELAKLAKERTLTEGEEKERQALRKEYIQAFRKNAKQQFDRIKIVD
ncbi:DUF896 domain-containing protein [Isachenkonia alkalipeptolytica]|uniref:UPF0291 protein ISALK_05290 n=1 Tax=Isachenkonia alkalipeptolytica TaxID=2565777 RepID=A0AA43XJB2_9CLOT|nr:DUF896 domain-containing protein [Isachenkonia alkalipeptolytica]NBG87910.1 DUF896 domain-containing protein [Isachenkonia alkalipeptolytica]